MAQDPSYYNLHDVSHQYLSDYLSELVESMINGLVNSKCISLRVDALFGICIYGLKSTIKDDMYVAPLNLGTIVAYYNVLYMTVEIYALSLKERTKMKGPLEVVSSTEFEGMPIRRHEGQLSRRIHERAPVKADDVDFEQPHIKIFIPLKAYFSRLQLPPDLATDQIIALEKVMNLLSACVDVMSSNAWLNALGTMD
jgi:pre-mRNA-splicing helicase BRR2